MKNRFVILRFLLSLTLITANSPLHSATASGAGAAASEAIVHDETSIRTITDFADIVFKNKQEFNAPDVMGQDTASLTPPLLSQEIIEKTLNQYLARAQEEIQKRDPWNNLPSYLDDLDELTTLATGYSLGGRTRFTTNPSTTDMLPFTQKEDVQDGEKVIYLGDLHGSVHSLLRNLLHMAEDKLIYNNFRLAPGIKLVMLGDMTDRGCYGAEVIYLLLRLKLQNLDNVFLLRGNHENAEITEKYGFKHELTAKYGDGGGAILYDLFLKFCRTLPLALFVQNSGVVVQCCHGGIEPYYSPVEFLGTGKKYDCISENIDGLNPAAMYGGRGPKHDVGKGFQWSDFNGISATWKQNTATDKWSFVATRHRSYVDNPTMNKWMLSSERGNIGFNANPKDLEKYLTERPGIVKIIRGHQDRESCCKLLDNNSRGPTEWCSIPPYIQQYGKSAPTGTPAEGFAFELSEEDRRKNRVRAATEGLNFSQMPDVVTWTSAVEGQGCTSEGYGTVTFIPGGYENWTCTIFQNPTHNDSITAGSPYGYVVAKPINYDEYDINPSHEWIADASRAGVSRELKAAIESGAAMMQASIMAAPSPIALSRPVAREFDEKIIRQIWSTCYGYNGEPMPSIREAVDALRSLGFSDEALYTD